MTFPLLALGLFLLAPIPEPGPIITEALPIRLYSYDPSKGGINCGGDCETLGNGMKVTHDLYDRSAACPLEWAGKTVVIYSAGEMPWMTFPCNDTGGGIRIAYEKAYGLVIRVDVLSQKIYDPGPYNYWRLKQWDNNCNEMESWDMARIAVDRGDSYDLRRQRVCPN